MSHCYGAQSISLHLHLDAAKVSSRPTFDSFIQQLMQRSIGRIAIKSPYRCLAAFYRKVIVSTSTPRAKDSLQSSNSSQPTRKRLQGRMYSYDARYTTSVQGLQQDLLTDGWPRISKASRVHFHPTTCTKIVSKSSPSVFHPKRHGRA